MNNTAQHEKKTYKIFKKYLSVPQKIKDIVAELGLLQETPSLSSSRKLCLVGSAVFSLIEGCALPDDGDLDFFMTMEEAFLTETPSFSTFIPDRHIPHLFIRNTKMLGGTSADLILSTQSLNENAWTRDFTICALFCEIENHRDDRLVIHDPTGRGFSDLKKKILDTVNDPMHCLQEDAVRVLRALKYTSRGFTPSSRLTEALHAWADPSCLDNAHFIHILIQQLESLAGHEFIEQLKIYRVIYKLGINDISPMPSDHDLRQQLLTILYLRQYVNHKATSRSSLLSPPVDDLSMIGMAQQKYIAYEHSRSAWNFSSQLHRRLHHATYNEHHLDAQIQEEEQAVEALSLELSRKRADVMKRKPLMKVYTELEAHITSQNKKIDRLTKDLKTLVEKNEADLLRIRDENEEKKRIAQEKMDARLVKEQKKLYEIAQYIEQEELSLHQLKEKHQTLLAEEINYDAELVELTHQLSLIDAALTQKAAEDSQKIVDMQAQELLRNDSHLTEKDASSGDRLPIKIQANVLARTDEEGLLLIFSNTYSPTLRALSAFYLGMKAEKEDLFFKAHYYFMIAMHFPEFKENAHMKINTIRARCLSIEENALTDAKTWYALGTQAKSVGKFDEAILYFSRAIDYDPTYVNAYIGRINIFHQHELWQDYINDYACLCQLILAQNASSTSNNYKAIAEALQKKNKLTVQRHAALTDHEKDFLSSLKGTWSSTMSMQLNLHLNTENRLELRVSLYKKIITLSACLSLAYGLAHFELALIYCKDEMAQGKAYAHFAEALCVLPDLKRIEPGLGTIMRNAYVHDEVHTCQALLSEGALFESMGCHTMAMQKFDVALRRFPKNIQTHWAPINLCFSIHRRDFITEEAVNNLIGLMIEYQFMMDPKEFYAILAELYFYNSAYAMAREMFRTLEKVYQISVPIRIFSKNLNQFITLNSINELRESNKESYSALYANPLYMGNLQNFFTVNRVLGQIAEDEGQYPLALHYFLAAKTVPMQATPEYNYKWMLCELVSVYIQMNNRVAAEEEIAAILCLNNRKTPDILQYIHDVQLSLTKPEKSSTSSPHTMCMKKGGLLFFTKEGQKQTSSMAHAIDTPGKK